MCPILKMPSNAEEVIEERTLRRRHEKGEKHNMFWTTLKVASCRSAGRWGKLLGCVLRLVLKRRLEGVALQDRLTTAVTAPPLW